MDWLDQYLHELNRPGTVVHLPPDKQSWNRPNPTKQQLSLIQDATIADMVRMRNIQEARQAEIDAGMGGGYDAGSAARERPATPAAPSGIPVSTQIIIVTGSNHFDDTYIKSGTVWYASDREIALVSGFWRIRNSETNQELNNPSSDANYIPTTGWTENGSPYAITITAA